LTPKFTKPKLLSLYFTVQDVHAANWRFGKWTTHLAFQFDDDDDETEQNSKLLAEKSSSTLNIITCGSSPQKHLKLLGGGANAYLPTYLKPIIRTALLCFPKKPEPWRDSNLDLLFLSPIPSRFNHSIKDWQCRQMWFFVLCQEHSTDINCQCQLHWHPIKTNKVVDRLFQDRISFWEEKGSFTDSMFIVCLQLSLWWLWIYFSSGRCNDL
jgi:hypothetical protein